MPPLTPQQAQSEVTAALESAWEEETPVAWPNRAFDPAKHKEYARFSWQPVGGDRAAVGDVEDGVPFRRHGILFIQLFTELGKGTARSNELEERALKFFETYRGRVRITAPGSVAVGADGAFWHVNVSAQFEYDSLRTSP